MNIDIGFNEIFKPVHSSRHRYVAMRGSAGSGKSVDTAQMYIIRLLQDPQRNLMCVRKVEGSNKVSTYAELTGAINRMGLQSYFRCTTSPLSIKCVNGNEVLFCGINDSMQREKLKSITVVNGKLTDAWCEEATELKSEDFEIIDDRFRGKLPSGQFYQIKLTFNPVNAQHWIKKRFFDYQDKNTYCHKSTYLDNAYCDDAYKERMDRRRILDPEGFQVYGLGEWGETEGIIFSNWEILDFYYKPETFDSFNYGQDFGFNHANALLGVGLNDGNIYIPNEIYVREKDTADIIKLAQAERIDQAYSMWCDSAEPDRIQMWRKAGYKARGVKKYPKCVQSSIDWLKQRKIYIHPCCTNTIKEISSWRWKKDSKTGLYIDEPVAFEDDAMAALRYGSEPWIAASRVRNSTKAEGKVEVKSADQMAVVMAQKKSKELHTSLGKGMTIKPF